MKQPFFSIYNKIIVLFLLAGVTFLPVLRLYNSYV